MNLHITSNKGVEINEGMMGLFFEDINYAADGGLYAELIENRSFEFLDSRGDKNKYYQIYDGGYGWSAYPEGEEDALMQYLNEESLNEVNPHYLRFVTGVKQKGFTNKAYDGINLKKGDNYKISFYARCIDYNGIIKVSVKKKEEIALYGEVELKKENGWHQYTLTLTAKQSVRKGTFIIELSEDGTVDFDIISMMPEEAVLGIFRKDLVELLVELRPGFIRFPGGCIIEGNDLNNRYQWKKSVGPIEMRKANWNRWAVHGNNEENNFTGKFKYYNQTLGIGYYEYFLLCEYIGAKALPVINVGLACQYQSDELVLITDENFKEYIQDALDLIEFANGGIDTKWGSLRAEMGHEKPFHLEFLGIGNEQWQTERVDFFERYELFEKAIHEKYPDMKLIGSAGPNVTSKEYKMAWDYHYEKAKTNANYAYAVDEHYYVKPEWFYENVHFYDNYPRDVKVFSGEYAAHPEGIKEVEKRNNWGGALAEAAFLTGVERNADVVILASYAPLLARIGYVQWSPDMIWFDDEKAYGTPSYYVQKLYACNMGDYTLHSNFEEEEEYVYQTVSYNEKERELIIKLVNASEEAKKIYISFDDKDLHAVKVSITELHSLNKEDCNSIEVPDRIVPEEKTATLDDSCYEIGASTFSVIRVKL